MTATWKPGETFKSDHYALYDELRDADGLLLGWIEQFTGQDEPSQFEGDSGDSCYAWARPQNQDEPINVPSMEVEWSIFKRLGCMQDVPDDLAMGPLCQTPAEINPVGVLRAED